MQVLKVQDSSGWECGATVQTSCHNACKVQATLRKSNSTKDGQGHAQRKYLIVLIFGVKVLSCPSKIDVSEYQAQQQ